MNAPWIDAKLKKLVTLCKRTHNYKKISMVGYLLISNRLDEIGIRLAIRVRKKEVNQESLWQYMGLINSVLKENLGIMLFKEDLIATMKKVEMLFISRSGELPQQYSIQLYEIYYALRELDIPNLHQEFTENDLSYTQSDPHFSSFFSFASSLPESHQDPEDRIKPLLLHKIKEKEHQVRSQLNEHIDSPTLEYALYLKKLEQQLEREDLGKITVKGKLKDNLIYQQSREQLLGLWILGGFLLFFLVGIVITYEMILYPRLLVALSSLTLLSFSVSIFFFLLFWNSGKKRCK